MKEIESILDRFVEGVFRLMLEHHQRQVVVMDLTLPQAQALRLLRSAALPTSKLASGLGISAPAVTQLTNRLFRKQLIERRSSDGDRRWVNIELTEKGRMVIDGFRQRRNEVFGEALRRLSDNDQSLAIEVLAKLADVIYEPDQPPSKQQRAPERHSGRRQQSRTPLEPTHASNGVDHQKVDHPPVVRPAKRMKIEWD